MVSAIYAFKKNYLSIIFIWLSGVVYLTWYNGLKILEDIRVLTGKNGSGSDLSPVLVLTILYFIWKPEAFKKLIQDFKSLF